MIHCGLFHINLSAYAHSWLFLTPCLAVSICLPAKKSKPFHQGRRRGTFAPIARTFDGSQNMPTLRLRALVYPAIAIAIFAAQPAAAQDPTYDFLIRNGRIVDGTGNPWFIGDVAIRDGKIVAVGRVGG